MSSKPLPVPDATALPPRADTLPSAQATWWKRRELPTWGVAVAIYGAWAVLVIYNAFIPWPILMVAGAYVLAWHFSLQHEAIHGWLSIPKWLRTALVWPPIGGWLPFEIYREAHSRHHRNTFLTYPGEDTESQYHRQQDWHAYTGFWRGVWIMNQTLLGRMVVGPAIRLRKQVLNEWRLLKAGDTHHVVPWLLFCPGIAAVLWFVTAAGHMPVWKYYAVMVYPGIGLGMLRAFIEHRWGEKPGQRTAVVESGWVFGLLFLFNNLHIIHHLYPAMPWFEIPRFWRQHREKLLAHNGNYRFAGYREIARRWLVRRNCSTRR
jgi:fatty acid desaturase